MFILLPNSSIFENLCKAATRINPSSVSQLKFSKISVASSFLATNEHARKGIEQTYIPLVCRCVKVINFQLYLYLPALHLYLTLHLPFYRFFAILLKKKWMLLFDLFCSHHNLFCVFTHEASIYTNLL